MANSDKWNGRAEVLSIWLSASVNYRLLHLLSGARTHATSLTNWTDRSPTAILMRPDTSSGAAETMARVAPTPANIRQMSISGATLFISTTIFLCVRKSYSSMDDPAMPHTTIGVCLVGGLVSFMLFGVMTTQMYIYYKRFSDDCLKLKALVVFMWYNPAHNIDSTECVPVNRTCDSAHTHCASDIFSMQTILGRPAPKSYETTVFFYGVTGAIGLQTTSLAGYLEKEVWRATVGWAMGTANDLMITSTLRCIQEVELLCFPAGNRSTAGSSYVVDPSLTGVISLFVTMRENFIWFAVFTVDAKIFSNSLLASLNLRETLHAINNQNISLSLSCTMSPKALSDRCDSKGKRNEMSSMLWLDFICLWPHKISGQAKSQEARAFTTILLLNSDFGLPGNI
ncbi:hypothetical protein DFH08DRAFT_825045 [Mycena albidolilacea]|uniref:DUF6534 domain-containing protein n=1 Tax=Mycena albidolilacea TaxID=1033008 RepID=A0AAD6Z3F1_9AGAR|nr:hypothetical protein DFH08DRAFT_825045 [Mycena albidolilacea]